MDAYETQDKEPLYTFNWTESKHPTSAAILAIADVSGEDPTTIEPLYNTIDPDSLNELFAPARSPRLTGNVQFEHHGYHLTITADGRGFVYDRAGSGATPSSTHGVGNPMEEYR